MENEEQNLDSEGIALFKDLCADSRMPSSIHGDDLRAVVRITIADRTRIRNESTAEICALKKRIQYAYVTMSEWAEGPQKAIKVLAPRKTDETA
jgi:hypothetical protein